MTEKTPQTPNDVKKVLDKALSRQPRTLRLTEGQRQAILRGSKGGTSRG